MDSDKQFVFQLSKKDLRELAEVANVQPGVGIELTRNNGRLEISVDRQQLRMWIQAVVAGREI